MNRQEAKIVAAALTAGCDGHGPDVASNACEQAADELNVLGQAMDNGATDWLVRNVLAGIESRLRAAAELNGAIREAESEAAQ